MSTSNATSAKLLTTLGKASHEVDRLFKTLEAEAENKATDRAKILQAKRDEIAHARKSFEDKLSIEKESLDSEKKAFAEQQKRMAAVLEAQKQKVTLDVGGNRFSTGLSTLKAFPGSRFESLLDGDVDPDEDDDSYFIDRDGSHFHLLLKYLRDPDNFVMPANALLKKELTKEAKFYCIELPLTTNATAKEAKGKSNNLSAKEEQDRRYYRESWYGSDSQDVDRAASQSSMTDRTKSEAPVFGSSVPPIAEQDDNVFAEESPTRPVTTSQSAAQLFDNALNSAPRTDRKQQPPPTQAQQSQPPWQSAPVQQPTAELPIAPLMSQPPSSQPPRSQPPAQNAPPTQSQPSVSMMNVGNPTSTIPPGMTLMQPGPPQQSMPPPAQPMQPMKPMQPMQPMQPMLPGPPQQSMPPSAQPMQSMQPMSPMQPGPPQQSMPPPAQPMQPMQSMLPGPPQQSMPPSAQPMQPMQPMQPNQSAPPTQQPSTDGFRWGSNQNTGMTIKPLNQSDHNTLRGWNDVPSNLMSKPRGKTNRSVAAAPAITAPVAMMTPTLPMNPGPADPSSASSAATAEPEPAVPPPNPVVELPPDAQAMRETFQWVVETCKQGPIGSYAGKINTVNQGLDTLYEGCANGSIGSDKIQQIHDFAQMLRRGDFQSGLNAHRALSQTIGSEVAGVVVPLKSLVSLVKQACQKGKWPQ